MGTFTPASLVPIDQRPQLLQNALTRIAQGEPVRHVAESIGITHRSLRIWMLSAGLEDDYKAAQEQCLIANIIEADEALNNAEDAVSVARSNAQCKFARWDAERRLPHLFGAKIETTVNKQDNTNQSQRLEELSNKLQSLLGKAKGTAQDVQINDPEGKDLI